MLRNLRLFKVDGAWPSSEHELSERLEQQAFAPCGVFQEISYGFEPPLADLNEVFCRRVMGVDLLQLRTQSRILPSAAIREALDERIAEFRQRTRRDPGRQEKRELKEEVHAELLPKSLLKSDRTQAIYLSRQGTLAIGSTTDKQIDAFIDLLGECLDGVSTFPIAFKQPAERFMTRLFHGNAPATFNLGRECRMRDPSEGGSSVTWLDMDIGDRHARALLDEGMQLDRLGFGFEGVLRGTLDQEWALRKLKLEGQEAVDEVEDEDPAARFDAELVIFAGALARLLDALEKA